MNPHSPHTSILPPLPLSVRPVQIVFDYAPYDCRVEIVDMVGRREFTFPLATITEEDQPRMSLDVYGDSVTLTLTPLASDFKPLKEDIQETMKDGWKEKLLGGLANMALSALSEICLRVACTYRVTLPPAETGENGTVPTVIRAELRGYFRSGMLLTAALDLLPVVYAYFEASLDGSVPPLEKARGVNRREVIRLARLYALAGIMTSILFYPLEVGSVKRFTKDKKVNRAMIKFYRLSPEKRQKLRDRWTKWVDT